MAMRGNTKMALCSIPLASLCTFTPPTRMPLTRSTPVLYGLKVLVRLGEVGPDSNAPADGTAMYEG